MRYSYSLSVSCHDTQGETYEIVNNLRDPSPIPIKHKPINTNILIMRNTKPLDQPGLLTKRTQSRHEPTITIPSLSNIIRSRTINVKARLVENITNALHALWTKIFTGLIVLNIGERVQTIVAVELEINFNVKVRIAVLFVDAAAFFDDLFDFGAACCCGVFVGCLGCCGCYLVTSFGGEISVCV
jgi:hypothetical protein